MRLRGFCLALMSWQAPLGVIRGSEWVLILAWTLPPVMQLMWWRLTDFQSRLIDRQHETIVMLQKRYLAERDAWMRGLRSPQ